MIRDAFSSWRILDTIRTGPAGAGFPQITECKDLRTETEGEMPAGKPRTKSLRRPPHMSIESIVTAADRIVESERRANAPS
ncbi:hypothetical protein [Streptomyces sp. SM13]|uniref:hypothetical protein n=1 Tax=Streptomyces sp. SM13 TaxID=1983803 RepID=UPI0011B03DE6|nr:hypothetical protein [Streptomyces sp. SM13]